jgi:hypothetical protein
MFADPGTQPVYGDVTVCFYCGQVLEFVTAGGPYLHGGLTLKAIPSSRFAKFPDDLQAAVREVVIAIRRRRGSVAG